MDGEQVLGILGTYLLLGCFARETGPICHIGLSMSFQLCALCSSEDVSSAAYPVLQYLIMALARRAQITYDYKHQRCLRGVSLVD